MNSRLRFELPVNCSATNKVITVSSRFARQPGIITTLSALSLTPRHSHYYAIAYIVSSRRRSRVQEQGTTTFHVITGFIAGIV